MPSLIKISEIDKLLLTIQKIIGIRVFFFKPGTCHNFHKIILFSAAIFFYLLITCEQLSNIKAVYIYYSIIAIYLLGMGRQAPELAFA